MNPVKTQVRTFVMNVFVIVPRYRNRRSTGVGVVGGTVHVTERTICPVPRIRTVTSYVPARSMPGINGSAKSPDARALPPPTIRFPKEINNGACGGATPLIRTNRPGTHSRAPGTVGVVSAICTNCGAVVGTRVGSGAMVSVGRTVGGTVGVDDIVVGVGGIVEVGVVVAGGTVGGTAVVAMGERPAVGDAGGG
jgi:hypothetical protein